MRSPSARLCACFSTTTWVSWAAHVQGKGAVSGLWSHHCWEWFIQLLDQPDSPWFDLGNGEQRDDVLYMALRQAVDFLKRKSLARTKKIGPGVNCTNSLLGIYWDSRNRWMQSSTLGPTRSVEMAARCGQLSPACMTWDSKVRVGPPYRFIADLGDLDHCWGVLAPGQSGHIASPHYADGIQPWFTAVYHPILFRREEVEQNLEARLVLTPLDTR